MERAPKAYKNIDFLNSGGARTLRILSEYLEPAKRFNDENIKHTVVFFGSARVKPGPGSTYGAAEEFAFQLASWSRELEKEGHFFSLCSGGGPGIMEAANRGAHRAGAKSIGLNISLPFEQSPNDFVTPRLNFEFHYFFMRKLWFLFNARALVVFPGGFGTMDELFETLTLIQTKKLKSFDVPILLYDPSFWENVINFKKLVQDQLIDAEDLNLFHYFSSPDEGMELIKPRLLKALKHHR